MQKEEAPINLLINTKKSKNEFNYYDSAKNFQTVNSKSNFNAKQRQSKSPGRSQSRGKNWASQSRYKQKRIIKEEGTESMMYLQKLIAQHDNMEGKRKAIKSIEPGMSYSQAKRFYGAVTGK